MADATARAHVASPTALTADPENVPGTETEYISNDAINRRAGLNKREARKQKRAQQSLPTPPDTSSETETSTRKPPKARKPRLSPPRTSADNAAKTSIPQFLATTMPPGNPIPLLICSIGNPGPTYANTLHSAGHIITSYIAGRKSYQPFTKGLSGLVSRPDNTTFSLSLLKGYTKTQGGPPEDDWTFWQSLSLMNVSGVGVKKAYAAWLAELRRRTTPAAEGRLVVVHDELESALGKVSVRESGASARGHNGLKSCQQQLSGVKWWRVGVGIGRPESRDPNVVSRYVLGKMRGEERSGLERAAPGVVDALRVIAEK
ncbi:Aminoacyl-tRNA hydrolase [Ascochyta rabiei]|uniref:peptidyl-tRNA hydrolase n=1 Tax=Didymella rabiei TaxID=5454 RepID=A0A162XFM0_DIDRA|nr:Aminoacyl-tRNA hydrolase [Ascochyta rabiei]KZM19522.1 aminoacyl-tRNA hydrolase [Ascochyta rabiei]UPX12511.1 Aminoacyl-tRNA hydrolase [Ascochyta rabiei]